MPFSTYTLINSRALKYLKDAVQARITKNKRKTNIRKQKYKKNRNY